MIRFGLAYFLAIALSLGSFVLAHARGDSPDIAAGVTAVICTGTGLTTTTIGPDGTPIESVHLCPDGAQIFAAGFFLLQPEHPSQRFLMHLAPGFERADGALAELIPSARGPPLGV